MGNRKDDVLDYFVKRIQRGLGNHLKKIILFGSRARGDKTIYSDYDCLVVLDEVSENAKDVIDDVAGDALYRYNAVFSAFPVSEERLNLQKFNPFLINVSKEGITL